MATSAFSPLLEFTHNFSFFRGQSLVVNNMSNDRIKLIVGGVEHLILPGQKFSHVSGDGQSALAFFLLGVAAVTGFWITRELQKK